jgi:superfamily II DNA or RNA helicase/HKD family nuclease
MHVGRIGMCPFTYNVVDFENSLKSSFIEENPAADERYMPRIVTNDKRVGSNVLSILKKELSDCTSFDFSVAFITASGVQVLVELFNELQRRRIKGRVLTSTYLNFNDPQALKKLLEYPNIECRVYQGDLHAKGYLFDRDGMSTIIIGSSNLTDSALTCNKEWNVLFRSFENGEIFKEAATAFESLWDDEQTAEVTDTWISEYERYRESQASRLMPSAGSVPFVLSPEQSGQPSEEPAGAAAPIRPNSMQTLALEALKVLHERDEPRALLVSATGTGKTYLSAMDVERTHPSRVLFIAHRERILRASLKSYRRILGDSYTYGLYTGGSGKPDATCMFAMVMTLKSHLDEFDPKEFDYIVIDEAHRTGGESYRTILGYFQPRFFLGMTATPSRTDGYDVYRLFNNVIAYRITLQDALENEMLAPFHYFGIADLEIDDETIDDPSLFNRLASEQRARHVMDKIEEYTVDKANRRGLIFCNLNEEAKRLSQLFNEHGYRTVAISGQDNDAERQRQINRLESGDLQYIFSVDILNEGVDIPSINQIIMLRRTESAIVFVQQLGRGLRKAEGKEYVLVLDFIGNYQQNYLVPIALSGDRTFRKDALRRIVKEGNTIIPGSSTISFDRISEARIFHALDEEKFDSARLIRGEYLHLKQVLGHIPTLEQFDENESIDPLIIIKKYGSYTAFLEKYEPDWEHRFSEKKLSMLKFLSQKFANGKRKEDLDLLKQLIGARDSATNTQSCLTYRIASARSRSVVAMLEGAFSKAGEHLIFNNGSKIALDEYFSRALDDDAFRKCVLDTIEFGIRRNREQYPVTYKDTDFVLDATYTREEICRFLHWEKEPNFQNVGGYSYDKLTNTFPVFINYKKDPSISITTQYEDRFLSDRELVAISKNKRSLTSPEIMRLKNAESNGMRCFLFVRKDKDKDSEFYFLGEMHPTGQFEQFTMRNSTATAVEITYHLEEPVRPDLYDFFLSDFEELSNEKAS